MDADSGTALGRPLGRRRQSIQASGPKGATSGFGAQVFAEAAAAAARLEAVSKAGGHTVVLFGEDDDGRDQEVKALVGATIENAFRSFGELSLNKMRGEWLKAQVGGWLSLLRPLKV